MQNVDLDSDFENSLPRCVSELRDISIQGFCSSPSILQNHSSSQVHPDALHCSSDFQKAHEMPFSPNYFLKHSFGCNSPLVFTPGRNVLILKGLNNNFMNWDIVKSAHINFSVWPSGIFINISNMVAISDILASRCPMLREPEIALEKSDSFQVYAQTLYSV